MHLHDIIGSIAAICTTIAFIPQVILVLKTRNTDSISFIMYSIFITGVALWAVFGYMTMQWTIIIANIITFILAFIIWFSKLVSIQKGREVS
ncbi:MAG: SemiSWEET transporter [Opitutaceae bacterium]|nr:SemiSWEET transporter [Cytophagales bacterium]